MTASFKENTGVPPVWGPTTTFQYSFEDNESIALWDVAPTGATQSTGGAADGLKYASVAVDKFLRKYINNSASFWVRFCFRIAATRDADRDIFLLGYTSLFTTLARLQYVKLTDKVKCWLTNKTWDRVDTWQTVEYQVSVVDKIIYVWVDGTYVGSASIADVSDKLLSITFGGTAADTVIDVDAIVVSEDRPGLPGQVVASAGGYVQQGDIELDGVPFNLIPGQYQEQDISGFAPRLGSGAPAYSDLSGFQHFLIPSFHHGLGQPEMTGTGQGDENRYRLGTNVDTTASGLLRLANAVEQTDNVTNVPAYDVMKGGEIISCDMAGKSVYGLKFSSAKASAAYDCLFWRDGDTLYKKAFTCTDGVRGLLYNGQYLFISLGGSGLRMQKTADLATFSDVGNDTLPPVDMGPMAVYDEFLWAADRDEPIVYRAAQTDGSDLAKETVLGLGAHRVGPGSVPINSMCPFEGKLYVGREDGLYTIVQDADYVYVHPVETFPRSSFNCRSMVAYEGYLIYAIGGHVYRLGGTSTAGTGAKMDISPGPLTAGFPGSEVEHWDSFIVSGDKLFAVGYAFTRAYVFCYNGSGWHCLWITTTDAFGAGYAAGLSNSPSSTNEPRIHWAMCRRYISGGLFEESYASANLGLSYPVGDTYRTYGDLYTSRMSFGLPLVPKLFRMVRLETSSLSSTEYILVTYTVHTGQEERTGTLGLLVQDDANFLLFPAGTWGTSLSLQLRLYGGGTDTPVVRTVVVQYMDRPPAVWGYSMTLDLSSPPRTASGESTSYTVESLKEHLRNCREKASYVTFLDKEGNQSDVFVSSGPRFMTLEGKDVAQLSLMVVQRHINAPGTVGVSVS